MIGLRKAVAVCALLLLGALIVTANPRGPHGGYEKPVLAMWVLLVPLAIAIGGIVREAYWAPLNERGSG